MNIKKSSVSRSQVVEYWHENKFDTLAEECDYIMDPGEPSCWCCNMFYNNTQVYNPKKHDDIYKVWDEASFLQICHIVPKSLGGTNDLSNLFLLCSDCHDKTPDTIFPEIFFESVRRTTPKIGKFDLEEINRIINKYDINIDKMQHIYETIASEEFKVWSKGKCGIHLFQGSRRGPGVKLETIIMLAVYYLDNIEVAFD